MIDSRVIIRESNDRIGPTCPAVDEAFECMVTAISDKVDSIIAALEKTDDPDFVHELVVEFRKELDTIADTCSERVKVQTNKFRSVLLDVIEEKLETAAEVEDLTAQINRLMDQS